MYTIQVESPEGTYYYHKKTRVSRWDKPDDAVSAAMKTRVEDAERSADSAFKVPYVSRFCNIVHID